MDANTRFPEEIRLIVSFEKAEKVVKAPKKPTNKRGVYIFSNLGSRELIRRPNRKQPTKFTPKMPIGILSTVNLFSASAK